MLAAHDVAARGGGLEEVKQARRTRALVGGTRILRVEVGPVAEHAIQVHQLQGHAAHLATEAITAGALLAAYLDEDERLSLQIQAESPRFAVTVDVSQDGAIRARFSPGVLREAEQLHGVMLVMKSVVGREVYRGVTPLEHPSLEAMLQQHLAESAQTPARVAIRGARGTFVERLPGEEIEDAMLDDFAVGALRGLEGTDEPLRWACSCSRQRVEQMLTGLGPDTIRSMIDEDGGAVVSCHFCTETVTFDVPQLQALL